MQDNEATLAILHQLRDLGVRIVDGRFRHRIFVAELSAQLSVRQDQDRSLFHPATLCDVDDASAIVQAITGLASTLNITTTAEGVETPAQLDKIRALGCTEMQGFLFSQPKTADEIARLFLRPGKHAAAAYQSGDSR